MNDNLYLIIIIGLTIFILFYGGHNSQNKVEYNTVYFDNLNTIIYFENKINKILKNISFENKNFININKYFDTTHILIPNFISCFFIQINPYTFFNIFNIVNKQDININMMILFNHNKHNNLELLINDSTENLYGYGYEYEYDFDNNYINNLNFSKIYYGYFYDLDKIISITGIYHIYNNSNENIIITCFILRKPFWHK